MELDVVFILVENFFGGDGRFHARLKVVNLRQLKDELSSYCLKLYSKTTKKQSPVMGVEFECLDSENRQYGESSANRSD